jgi:hypothetical protein
LDSMARLILISAAAQMITLRAKRHETRNALIWCDFHGTTSLRYWDGMWNRSDSRILLARKPSLPPDTQAGFGTSTGFMLTLVNASTVG